MTPASRSPPFTLSPNPAFRLPIHQLSIEDLSATEAHARPFSGSQASAKSRFQQPVIHCINPVSALAANSAPGCQADRYRPRKATSFRVQLLLGLRIKKNHHHETAALAL
jgi:hypothetical protein